MPEGPLGADGFLRRAGRDDALVVPVLHQAQTPRDRGGSRRGRQRLVVKSVQVGDGAYPP